MGHGTSWKKLKAKRTTGWLTAKNKPQRNPRFHAASATGKIKAMGNWMVGPA
jgi:hypothetical protein